MISVFAVSITTYAEKRAVPDRAMDNMIANQKTVKQDDCTGSALSGVGIA